MQLYYLHTNGDLIFKREDPGDLQESPFVKHFWFFHMDSRGVDRETAWTIVVEATALGAQAQRIKELATWWQCTDEDAQEYAKRVGCVLEMDGNQWCAHRQDFINLQESPAGFGATALEAMAELAKALGLQPSKLGWHPSFQTLLKQRH